MWSLDLFRRESNMPILMIGGWIVPVSGLQRFNHEYCYGTDGP